MFKNKQRKAKQKKNKIIIKMYSSRKKEKKATQQQILKKVENFDLQLVINFHFVVLCFIILFFLTELY